MPPVDRYCQECDIRFSNLKTFRAHKLHYCSTRNVIKRTQNPTSSPSPNLSVDSRITPPLAFSLPVQNSPQPFVALNTNPVLIIPYALIQAGNVLPGTVSSGLSSQDGVYLMLPDGSIQLVAQAVTAPMVRVVEPSSPVLQPLLTANTTQVSQFRFLKMPWKGLNFGGLFQKCGRLLSKSYKNWPKVTFFGQNLKILSVTQRKVVFGQGFKQLGQGTERGKFSK